MYIVRSSDPQDHEGYPGVVATLKDEDEAKETVRFLSEESETAARALKGALWFQVAFTFSYDEVPVARTAEEAIEQFRLQGVL